MLKRFFANIFIYLAHSYCHQERSYCRLAYLKWAIDVDACACRHFQAVDWLPFVELANGWANVEMVELSVMLKVALEVMDSIVDFDSAAEIVRFA